MIRHGTLNSYNHWSCRCSLCKAANAEWCATYATRRKPSKKRLPDDLVQLSAEVTPEVAALIQEQYDDDQAKRYGYANRYPDNSVEDVA